LKSVLADLMPMPVSFLHGGLYRYLAHSEILKQNINYDVTCASVRRQIL